MSINDVNTKGFIRWIDMNESKKAVEQTPQEGEFLNQCRDVLRMDREKPVSSHRAPLSTL